MPILVNNDNKIKEGDFFEDSFYHPCLCFEVNYEYDEIIGIYLVDGNIRHENIIYSGLRILTFKEAVHWRFNGPDDDPDFKAPWCHG